MYLVEINKRRRSVPSAGRLKSIMQAVYLERPFSFSLLLREGEEHLPSNLVPE